MKRFKYFLRTFFIVFLLIFTINTNAEETNLLKSMDSVDISLLTCGPGKEIYSMFGHSALRVNDKIHHQDLAFNYGMFSFDQPYFISRFILGLTDYQLGIQTMSNFMEEYEEEGRWVIQQDLKLTRKEKLDILQALSENAKEENATYRYNFFYDNCTTRARDMILTHIHRAETNISSVYQPTTYRKEIHKWNISYPWTRCGEDLLLGLPADLDINKEKQQFLPDNLCKDIEDIHYEGTFDSISNMNTKLVGCSFYLLQAKTNVENSSPFMTPFKTSILIFIIILGICTYEYRKKKKLWVFDLILNLLTGLIGLVLFIMIFSKHPTVSFNLQILLFNPLNLIFGWSVINSLRKKEWSKKGTRYMTFSIICVILMLTGRIFQNYADGVMLLALSLLIRNIFNFKYSR